MSLAPRLQEDQVSKVASRTAFLAELRCDKRQFDGGWAYRFGLQISKLRPLRSGRKACS